jgi:hypothetical protein
MNQYDKYDIRNITEKRTAAPSSISCGVTWVDGRIIFHKDKNINKQGAWIYGICHFSNGIFLITPRDHVIPTTLTTILVSPFDNYCQRAYSCLDFDCKLNKFNRDIFETEIGDFAKEFPFINKEKPFWFNSLKWKNDMWAKKKLPINGGVLKFDANKETNKS